MGVLTLARHGQAAFLTDDYDKLTALGEKQSRLLGAYWAEQKTPFDAVYSGPRLRQIRTAELAAEEYRRSGLDLPDPRVIPELDEYDSTAVMRMLLPELVEQDESVRKLAETYERSRGTQDERKRFQLLFDVVMRGWITGLVKPQGLETWTEFISRVRLAVQQMIGPKTGAKSVVAFTSGGPVAVAIQLALGISDEKTLELNWQVRNASVTEFLFSGSRFTLDRFNSMAHISDRGLWSYR